MELINIQTPGHSGHSGHSGPELKSIKIPRGAKMSVIVAPNPTQTHTQFPMKNIAQSQGGPAIYRLYRYVPL